MHFIYEHLQQQGLKSIVTNSFKRWNVADARVTFCKFQAAKFCSKTYDKKNAKQ